MGLVVTLEQMEHVPVLALTGELDIYTVETFRRTAEPISEHEAVIVDMGAVDLVDSSGLGALLALCQTPDGRRTVVLVCAGLAIPRLLELTRLDEHFIAVDDREAGIEALRAEGEKAAGDALSG